MGTGKTYSTKYLLDSNNSSGVAGQVLSTTSTGIDWVDANTVPGTGLWLANGNDIYNSNSGNVGIDVTAPTSSVHVNGLQTNSGSNSAHNPTGTMRLNFAGASGADEYGASLVFTQRWWTGSTGEIAMGQITGVKETGNGNYGGGLAFFTSNSTSTNLLERLRINELGNVGIGTTSPTSPLTIKSNSTSSSSSGLTIQSNGNTNNIFELAEKSTDGARLQMYDAGVAKIALYTDGTDNYISAGNVGIGATSPSKKLHVVGDQLIFGDLLLEGSANSFRTISMNTVDGSDNQTLYLCGGQTASTARGGLVQIIGNEVATTGGSVILKAGNVSTGDIDFYTANTQKMIINNAGNVGIGTTSPGAKLHVEGTGDLVRLVSTNAGSAGAQMDMLQFSASPADDDIMGLINMGGYYSGTNSAYFSSIRTIATDISARKGALSFFTRSGNDFTEKMHITSSADANKAVVAIGITPSNWYNYTALQVGTGSLQSPSSSTITLGCNYYVDSGVSTTETYITNGSATAYQQGSGTHAWYTAPSGTAGNGVTFTERMRITNAGNVGIGTTTPTNYKLEVNGNVKGDSFGTDENTTARIFSPSGAAYNGSGTQTGYLIMELPDNGAGGVNNMMSGVIRVFDYAYGESFDVRFSGYWYSGYNWTNCTAYVINEPGIERNFPVKFGKSTGASGSEDRPYIAIADTTSIWSYCKFSVIEYTSGHSNMNLYKWNSGWAASLSSTLPGSVLVTVSNTQTNNWKRIGYDLSYNNGGNVGIGTTSPQQKLDTPNIIIGGSSIAASYRANATLMDNLGGTARFYSLGADNSTGGSYQFNSLSANATAGSGTVMTILNSGNVGIGTTAPLNKLHVAGSVRATSGVYFNSTSTAYFKIENDSSNNELDIYGGSLVPGITIDNSGLLKFGGYGLAGSGTPTKLLGLDSNSNVVTATSFNLILDDTPAANTTSGSGNIVNWSVSETVTAGTLYAVKTNGGWTTADADSEAKSTYMLAIALGSNATAGMLLQGFFYKSSHGFTIGAPLYVSNTAGAFSNSRPTGTGDYVRIIGYATSANYIYFDPDKTWVKIA